MTNESHYASPSAFRRALTDRLKALAKRADGSNQGHRGTGSEGHPGEHRASGGDLDRG
jgi:hypothetical protein